MAFKDDPIAFMEANVVLVGGVASQSCQTTARLEKQSENVYKLVKGSGPDSFKIYWCHYKSDDTHHVTVGRDADFMFTPRMDGCSFAVGMPAADGAVTVAHANTRDEPTSGAIKLVDEAMAAKVCPPLEELSRLQTLRRQLVMAEQKSKLQGAIGSNQFAGYLSSTTYQNAELTTFGVRDTKTDQWSFHFQARRGNSAGQVVGCFEIQGRTKSTKT